jgi:iron(II)-dependent oxidoreductase
VGDWYEDYTAAAVTNPTGPKEGKRRVIRGGGWNGSSVAWVRPTFRFHASPEQKSHGVGFRCAKTL